MMSDFPIPEELRASHFQWDVPFSVPPARLGDPDLGEYKALHVRPSGNAKKWAEALRDHQNLEYRSVWTGYSPQSLFDSIASITTLTHLAFGNLRAADISGLANLKQLQYLSIASLSSASTLKPLTQLSDLISLSIGISRKITSLEDFSDNLLHSLRALHLGESSERVVTVDSMDPLGELRSLEYLALGRIRSSDKLLAGLLKLPRLKSLEIDKNARFCGDDINRLRSEGVLISKV